MSSSTRGHRCVICRRNKGDCESLKMHRFPRDVSRCQKWVKTLNIPFLYNLSPQVLNSNYVVCSDHFEENQYLNGRLMHNTVPVKNLIKYKWYAVDDWDDGFCDKDLSLPQKEEWMKKSVHADAVKNICDKDWPFLEFTQSFYDTKIQPTNEVRVGPSFSNCDVEPPSNPVIIPLHGEGKDIAELPPDTNSDDSSSDYIVSDYINPDELSDSENNAMKVNTLECIVSNPSVKFISKEGSILCSLGKKTSMFAKHLDASYFEKHLNWTSQQKKQVTEIHGDDPLMPHTTQRKNISASKSSRQVLFHPGHEALRLKKYGIGCSGHWNTYGFSVLEEKAQSLKTEDKLCGIVFHFFELAGVTKATVQQKRKSLSTISDAIVHLESPSTFRGLVIMVKGLHKKWKYILRYDIFASTLQAEDIKEMLESCVVMLQDISYKVKFLVCNKDPLNELLKDMFEITYTKPYFTVGGENIYFYFDPCNLLQNTLNEFLKTDVYVGNNVATWKYVLSFLQKDSEQDYKLAPNLSLLNDIPVCCEGLSGSENDVALEVFSSAVSTGIYMYSTSGLLPEEAIHTSKFLYTLNKLMYCFLKSKPNISKGIPSSSEHMEGLVNLESVLMTWKIAYVDYRGGRNPSIKQYYNKKRKSVPKGDCEKEEDKKLVDMGSREVDPLCLIDNFIPHWLNNVSALKQMCKELHEGFELKHLITQSISQNCSKDIMAAVKKHSKNYSSLNVTDFEIAIRSLLRSSIRRSSYLPAL